MPNELLLTVEDVLTDAPATAVMNSPGNWHGGHWGDVFADVKTVIVHLTVGWPGRGKADGFVHRYTVVRIGESQHGEIHPCANCPPTLQPAGIAGCTCTWGIGPMYYLSNDGTLARLVSNRNDEARITFHGGWVNDRAIGVETGNLFRSAAPPGDGWLRLSQHPATEDIPGANLFVRDLHDNPREVIACWWTTAHYAGPAREPVGAGLMLFSEAQYRSWATLGRFLAEQFDVPRNLPLLPWETRVANVNASANYRRIVLADPAFDAIVADLPAAWHMTANMFENDPAALQTAYQARIGGGQNDAWLQLFNTYRGFHGHDFTGDNGRPPSPNEHDCPGPLFDWHRFARELWDWWWYPFDVVDVPPFANPTTAAPRRGYQRPDRSTPLLEHYFDDDNQNPIIGGLDGRHDARLRDGILGSTSAPATWRLDQGSPVYALANGELIAARYAQPTGPVSMSFLLVRHLVFHQTVGGADAVLSLRLDYDTPASTVYSLYMHIGDPPGLDLAAFNPANPDWLNRVHIRKRECDLGLTFYDGSADHHGVPEAAWNQPLPGQAARPTLVDGWRIDQQALIAFLGDLQVGNTAIAPFTSQSTPIRIILGDYLGNEGVVALENGADVRGIRVEVFSPLVLGAFTQTGGGGEWDPVPPGLVGMPVQRFPSEWARDLDSAEQATLEGLGVDVDLVTWWPDVARAMALDPNTIAVNRLPDDGNVFHYQPFDFLRWINSVTWQSEWPKYQVHDAGGNAQAAPPQPRSRRR